MKRDRASIQRRAQQESIPHFYYIHNGEEGGEGKGKKENERERAESLFSSPLAILATPQGRSSYLHPLQNRWRLRILLLLLRHLTWWSFIAVGTSRVCFYKDFAKPTTKRNAYECLSLTLAVMSAPLLLVFAVASVPVPLIIDTDAGFDVDDVGVSIMCVCMCIFFFLRW